MALKPTGAKRGRPQIRTTPTGSVGRSVSKTPSNEGRSNGKRTETPSSMANGDSKTHWACSDLQSQLIDFYSLTVRCVCVCVCVRVRRADSPLMCPPLCRHSSQENQENVGYVRLRQSVQW